MTTPLTSGALRGTSNHPDAATAVAELAAQLASIEAGLVVFFASPRYDRDELAAAVGESFAGTQVIGCTTAGEIGPNGYAEGGMTAFALRADDFQIELGYLDGLADLALDAGTHAMQSAMNRMRERGGQVDGEHCFAFVLVDGLSMREEAVVSSLNRSLGDIHLFGGSAGDNLEFQSTAIYQDGRFDEGAAVFALVHTDLPFEVFRTQHFVETDAKLVITEADPLSRIVTEINAEPAAREYARQVGLEIEELTPQVFAAHPVLVRVGGETFVRSIARVNEDESLSFFCAIEPGTVLTVARGVDLVGSLQSAFDEVRARVGEPQLTIGCDCILRSLESQRENLRGEIAQVLEQHRTVGFATYGEQFDAMHVNQTFTGVMIGARRVA